MTQLKEGTRIKLTHMPDDPYPIPAGTTGTVTRVGQVWPANAKYPETRQVFVRWDIGRSLIMIDGIDQYEILNEPPAIQE